MALASRARVWGWSELILGRGRVIAGMIRIADWTEKCVDFFDSVASNLVS